MTKHASESAESSESGGDFSSARNVSNEELGPTLMALMRKNARRALVVSVVVGTLLIAINHGDHIEQEPVCDNFWLKCLLCYLTPFLVSLFSAVVAARATAKDPHEA